MKLARAILIGCMLLGLSACSDDDDDCETEIAGCDADDYSCPESLFCYETRSGCEASGDCD